MEKDGLGDKIPLVFEIRVKLKLLERRGNSRLGEIHKQRKREFTFWINLLVNPKETGKKKKRGIGECVWVCVCLCYHMVILLP